MENEGYKERAEATAEGENRLPKMVWACTEGVNVFEAGFQPLGVSTDNEKIVVADYFLGGLRVLKADRTEGILQIEHSHTIPPDKLFPPVYPHPAGRANRMQGVALAGGALAYTRNAARDLFVRTPESGISRREFFREPCESLAVSDGFVYAVENFRQPKLRKYVLESGVLAGERALEGDFMYGIGVDDGFLYLISDRRSSREHGIYIHECEEPFPVIDKITRLGDIKDVYGNGLAFLPKGELVVTQYNYTVNDVGEPGRIIVAKKW